MSEQLELDFTAELDGIRQHATEQWLARRERVRLLRAELAIARAAGKALRHQRRLEQIARAAQSEGTT